MLSPFTIHLPPPIKVALPPELSTEAALLAYLELSTGELKKIWWYRGRMYHQFSIAKGKGSARTISAPDKRLKHLQRRLCLLLNPLYRVRDPVHGFVEHRSVKTNALAHLKKRFILNVDLKDFFPSITENRVVGLLEALGIESTVARIVARLSCNKDQLPQGAPTSPVLSNMICFRLDKQLMALAKEARCIFTRYADDITFSSHQPMTSLFESAVPPAGKFSPELLAPKLRNTFGSNGFALNSEKAHYADKHSRRMVTGLKVNELLNVDRRYVRNVRSALYSVETLGVAAAQKKFSTQHAGGNSELGSHLAGKITWLRHIRGPSDPVFRSLASRFNTIFPNRKVEIAPTALEKRDRAVWVVEHMDGEMWQGTAFFAKDVGLVTANHCVSGSQEIEVYHPSKPANRFKAKILRSDEPRDLAILSHEIPSTEFYELPLSTTPVAVGQELVAVGYPGFGPGDGLNVRQGTVSSLTTKHGVKLIEVSQKLAPGMSGGPIIDGNEAAVGVIFKGGPSEPRDFATHVDVLTAWLAEVTSSENLQD